MDYKILSEKMETILGLDSPPIAVKIVKQEENVPDIKSPDKKSRYCQLLMLARKGYTFMLAPETIACPAAKAALGFDSLPEKISGGQMLCTLGLFMNEEAAAKTMRMMPRLKLGSAKAVIAGPLGSFPSVPDVVIVESYPEHIMWLCLARNFKEDGRLSFSSSVFQCCCVDVTVVPYISSNINISPGCYGCREATDIPPEHMFIGIPAKILNDMVESLESLSRKAMIMVREKRVHKSYTSSQPS